MAVTQKLRHCCPVWKQRCRMIQWYYSLYGTLLVVLNVSIAIVIVTLTMTTTRLVVLRQGVPMVGNSKNYLSITT